MCDQTEIEYKAGEVVWFKLSNLWWPAQVQDQANLKEEVTQGLRKTPIAVVKFFNEEYYDFVKDIKQIYHYNSSKKWEFIKKGMDQYRARGDTNKMSKFPKDIVMAEELTGGNVNILDDPRLAPEEKVTYKDLFSTPKMQKEVKNVKKSKNHLLKSKTLAGNSPSMGKVDSVKNYIKEYRIQSVSEPSTERYQCPDCSFVCSRVILLAHHRSFNKGLGCPKPPIKFGKSILSNVKVEKSSVKRKSVANDTPHVKKKLKTPTKGPSEEVTKKPVKTPIPKEIKEKDKKKLEAMREQLLMDWNEDVEEAANSSEDVISPIQNKKDDKQSVGNTNKTSCFDFEDNDDDVNIDRSIRFGQKLPRVIPKEDKNKDKVKVRTDDDALEEEFNNLMNETIVHAVPSIIDSFLLNSSALPGSPGKAEANLGSKANNNSVQLVKEEKETDKVSGDQTDSIKYLVESESSKKSEDDNTSLLNALESDSPAELVHREDLQGPAKRSNSSLFEEVVKKIKTDADLLASLRSDSDSNSGPAETRALKKKQKVVPPVPRTSVLDSSKKSPTKKHERQNTAVIAQNKVDVSKDEILPKSRASRRRSSSGKTIQSSDNTSKPVSDQKLSDIQKDNRPDRSSSHVKNITTSEKSVKLNKEKSNKHLKTPKTDLAVGSPLVAKKSPSPLKHSSSSSPIKSVEKNSAGISPVKIASPSSSIKKSKSVKFSAKSKHSAKKLLSLTQSDLNDLNSEELINSLTEESVEKRIAMLLSDSSSSESIDCSHLSDNRSSGKTKAVTTPSKINSRTRKSTSMMKPERKHLSKTGSVKDPTKSNSTTSPAVPTVSVSKRNRKGDIKDQVTQNKKEIASPCTSKVPASPVELQHSKLHFKKDSMKQVMNSKQQNIPFEMDSKGKLKQTSTKLGKKDYQDKRERRFSEGAQINKVNSKIDKSLTKILSHSKSVDLSQSPSKLDKVIKARTSSILSPTHEVKSPTPDKTDGKSKVDLSTTKESSQSSVLLTGSKKEISPQANKIGDSRKKKKRTFFEDPYSDLFKPDIILVSKPSPKTSVDSASNSSSKLKPKDELGSSPKMLSPPTTPTYSNKEIKLTKDKSPSKSSKKPDSSKATLPEPKTSSSKNIGKVVESSVKSPSNETSSESSIVMAEGKHVKSPESHSKSSKKSDKTQKSDKINESKLDKNKDQIGGNENENLVKPVENVKESIEQLMSKDELNRVSFVDDVTINESRKASIPDSDVKSSDLNSVTDRSDSNISSSEMPSKVEASIKIEENSNSEFKLLEVLTGDDSSSGHDVINKKASAFNFDGVVCDKEMFKENMFFTTETVSSPGQIKGDVENMGSVNTQPSELSETASTFTINEGQKELQSIPPSTGKDSVSFQVSGEADISKCISVERNASELIDKSLSKGNTEVPFSSEKTVTDSSVTMELLTSLKPCSILTSDVTGDSSANVTNTISLKSEEISSKNLSVDSNEANDSHSQSSRLERADDSASISQGNTVGEVSITVQSKISQESIDTSNLAFNCRTDSPSNQINVSTKDSVAEKMEEMFSSTDLSLEENEADEKENSTLQQNISGETEELKNKVQLFTSKENIMDLKGEDDCQKDSLNDTDTQFNSLCYDNNNTSLRIEETTDIVSKNEEAIECNVERQHFKDSNLMSPAQHKIGNQRDISASNLESNKRAMSSPNKLSSKTNLPNFPVHSFEIEVNATSVKADSTSLNLPSIVLPCAKNKSQSDSHCVEKDHFKSENTVYDFNFQSKDPINDGSKAFKSQEPIDNESNFDFNEDSKLDFVSEVVISSDSNEKKDEIDSKNEAMPTPFEEGNAIQYPTKSSSDNAAALDKTDDIPEDDGFMYEFHDEITISDDPSSEVVITTEGEDKSRDSVEEENNIYNFDDQTCGSNSIVPPPLAKIKPKNSMFGDLKINLSKSANVVDLPKDFREKIMSSDFLTPDKIKEIFQQGGSSSLSQGSSVLTPIVVPPQSLFDNKLNSINSSLSQSAKTEDVQSMELDINSMPVVIADASEIVSTNVTSSVVESSLAVTSSASSLTYQTVTASTSHQIESSTASSSNAQSIDPPVDHYVKLVKPGSVRPKPGSKLWMYSIPSTKPLTFPMYSKQSANKIIKYIPQTKCGLHKLSSDSFSGKELVIVTSSGKKRVILHPDSFLGSLSNKTPDRNPSKHSLVVTLQNSDTSTPGKSKLRSVASMSSRTVEFVSSNSLKFESNKTLSVPPQLKFVPQSHLVSFTGDKKRIMSLQQLPTSSPESSKVSQFKEPDVSRRRMPKIIPRKASILKASRKDSIKQTISPNQTIYSLLNKNEQQSNEAGRQVVPAKKNLDCIEPNPGPILAPKEDILAKALADTQVFQESELHEENTSCYVDQFQMISPVVVEPTGITGAAIQPNILTFNIPTVPGVMQPSMPLLSEEVSSDKKMPLESCPSVPLSYQSDYNQIVMPAAVESRTEEKSLEISQPLCPATLMADINLAEIELPPGRPPDSSTCSTSLQDIASIPLPPEPYSGPPILSFQKQSLDSVSSHNLGTASSDTRNLASLFHNIGES